MEVPFGKFVAQKNTHYSVMLEILGSHPDLELTNAKLLVRTSQSEYKDALVGFDLNRLLGRIGAVTLAASGLLTLILPTASSRPRHRYRQSSRIPTPTGDEQASR